MLIEKSSEFERMTIVIYHHCLAMEEYILLHVIQLCCCDTCVRGLTEQLLLVNLIWRSGSWRGSPRAYLPCHQIICLDPSGNRTSWIGAFLLFSFLFCSSSTSLSSHSLLFSISSFSLPFPSYYCSPLFPTLPLDWLQFQLPIFILLPLIILLLFSPGSEY